ncbi:hypothetical protein [Solwaraspora sp. WMMD792]|uniref:hypothetical protein n=1 Tax=unclassified Solwaraspora TaxID=2627926 RepID=UPI0024162911|nr:hypothetical protein [Solwaraspora sp. WMMD792]MDG4774153.1 hypothetical protein [Solwaraspora sp. WMMD792]
MQVAEVLDVLEALFQTSKHPDITDVRRYGQDTEPGGNSPAGVRVYYSTGSTGMLWAAVGKPAPAPASLPAEMPAPRERARRTLAFAVQLLDFARPEEFTSWEPCAFTGVHSSPSGVKITCRDGGAVFLRATATTGPGGIAGEPNEDPYPDYQIPEGVRSWRQEVGARSAVSR